MSIDRALGGTGTWLDDRLHGARGVRVLLRKIFPDHWSFLLGEIILYSFVILLLTGTFLTLWFQPSMTDVIYHGSYTPLNGVRMSEAYASTLHISFDVRGGLLIRQIHHWAADLFMAGIMAHMIRVFFTGAYRKPREINWLIGIILFTLGLLEGLFGYSLPDDLLSGAGLRILEGVIQSLPIVGTYLAFFLFGGPFPGNQIIPRLYILHVLLIPGVILALITVHLFLMFHQKHTQMPGKGRTNENVVGAPMYPYFMAKTGAFFFFVFAACALAATFAQINPIWLYGPFNPVAMSAGSQPDFYMGALEGALRIMPAWQWAPWGHTFAFNVFIPALVPLGLIFGGAAAWPFIEQWITGDRREHHINDRPRNAPTRTAIGIGVITFYGILWAEGANDIIADHFDIPLYWTTWAARVGIFVGPVIAYIITKRICLGLQRKDNHLVEHGVETGNIRQLPGGEFVEETRPVSDERLAVLTSRVEHPPLPPGETAETDVPAPGMRGGLGRVRERLYKVVTESTPIPSSHGNGHGNGHAVEAGDGHEHAALGSGTGPDSGADDEGPQH
jgi:ubiquinol-cytochrome c reductase cytochrome b subunit